MGQLENFNKVYELVNSTVSALISDLGSCTKIMDDVNIRRSWVIVRRQYTVFEVFSV